jgi:predicted nucleic-acid-binding protein
MKSTKRQQKVGLANLEFIVVNARITADTNLLLRAVTEDHPKQSAMAQAELAGAELIALPMPALCELAWVLASRYHQSNPRIALTIRRLVNGGNVAVDRAAVESGLAFLDNGGDFADGVIAHQGRMLGGAVFVSFDKQAVKLLLSQDKAARLLD